MNYPEIYNKLIKEAQDLLQKSGKDPICTVAAAALTEDGSIITSLNVFHFTGGPCAEGGVITQAMSQNKIITHIAAIGDRDRGIMSPCGHCRQMLVDYFPACKVLVNDQGNIIEKSVIDLLPFAYFQVEED